MKSPRFDIRAAPLRIIFSAQNLEAVWRKKVRVSMREQILRDGIEHFDFHVSCKLECQKLSRIILEGNYVPSRAQRILVEKSKGLCRQIVIPSPTDALVLQCLSDALYQDVRDRAPTNRAFFKPREHRFSAQPNSYGSFASWLNFQREIFHFSRTRKYVVVTDIANYYDSISYEHLRNVISSISGVEECVLDMLIYVLSDLLWQPDYTPRIEIGLPQIDLDAPRLLAHCFLYELDAYLASDPSRDFVRFMDDIDIGVDTIVAAKKTLKEIDLVLQTKQVRLNSGKTEILSGVDAIKHFRVFENARLDTLKTCIERRQRSQLNTDRERRVVQLRISRGLARGHFDRGNGEKILKRLITLAGTVGARISPDNLRRIILLRPGTRENIFIYIRRTHLTIARSKVLAACAESGLLVDDAGLVNLVNHLVETTVKTTSGRHDNIMRIVNSCETKTYYDLYCRLWLQSKYDTPAALLSTIDTAQNSWVAHEPLGRLIGAFAPLFTNTAEESAYLAILGNSRNPGVRDTWKFHLRLADEPAVFDSMYDALKNPNPSRGTRITHAKFLCLLSALKNQAATAALRQTLRNNNASAFRDIYYRRIARRLNVL